MAVRIRLTRVGATKRPAYRVIAIDKRRSRDGRALEILGFYDPLTEPATVHLESERISAWIGKGAQPSDTVVRLMAQAEREAASPPTEKPRRPARPKASTKPKAAAKAAKAKAEEQLAADEPVAETGTAELAVEPAAATGADEADATGAEAPAAAEEAAAADDLVASEGPQVAEEAAVADEPDAAEKPEEPKA